MDQGVTDVVGVASALAQGWRLVLAGSVVAGVAVFFIMLATGRITLSKMRESWWFWWIP